MLERIMTRHRGRVSSLLVGLLALTMALWLFRSPLPLSTRAVFAAVSVLMAPLAYFGVCGILHFNVRVNRVSVSTLRRACGFFFFPAAAFIVLSTLFAIIQAVVGRPALAANTFALGAALAVMKVWEHHVAPKEPQ